MKIAYAGYNLNRINWGCRATSTALGTLLHSAGHDVSTIDGTESSHLTRTKINWGGARPKKLWETIDSIKYEKAQRAFGIIQSSLGIKDDFIRSDPGESSDIFLKIKDNYKWSSNIYSTIASSEALVINGEGTYIFSNPTRRDHQFYDFLIHLALELGKKVYVLNAMFSDCPKTGRNDDTYASSAKLLNRCDAVTARDPISFDYAKEMGLNNVHYFPDALFTWSEHVNTWSQQILGNVETFRSHGYENFRPVPNLDLSEPFICLSGSSSAAWTPKPAYKHYKALAQQLKKLGVPILVVPTCNGDRFLVKVAEDLELPFLPVTTPIRLGAGILGKSSVFVSGRFHPSILASDGGSPCVFLGSNSSKMTAVQKALGYPDPIEYPALPSEEECEKIAADASDSMQSRNRSEILAKAKELGAQAASVVELLK